MMFLNFLFFFYIFSHEKLSISDCHCHVTRGYLANWTSANPTPQPMVWSIAHWRIAWLPSGFIKHGNGKFPRNRDSNNFQYALRGKSPINGPFSTAMFDYRRVVIILRVPMFPPSPSLHLHHLHLRPSQHGRSKKRTVSKTKPQKS